MMQEMLCYLGNEVDVKTVQISMHVITATSATWAFHSHVKLLEM